MSMLVLPKGKIWKGGNSMGKLTVTVPEELHERIRKALENKGMTTAQFIQQAVYMYLDDHNKKGEGNMATRTIAFQVTEELYQKVKEYLIRYEQVYGRKLSQKEFIVTLIEQALEEADEDFEAARADEDEGSHEDPLEEDQPENDDPSEYDGCGTEQEAGAADEETDNAPSEEA
ncbi:translation initiation factor 2 [Candidatus Allofournierella merdavium]|uniref:translation initiation factor 2 n=1 Tax=Candidatus Allofournierella merdavium TaxID=2838593 RepID=UPI00374F3BC9